MIKVKKEHKSPIVSSDAHFFFSIHKKKKIELKDNNRNDDDQANSITEYLIARNQSTEVIDVDDYQGIDDNNKSKLDVPEIIDARTKIINVVKYTNTIYAEVVDRKNYIPFVSEVTGHILRHKVHYRLCYSNDNNNNNSDYDRRRQNLFYPTYLL